jgi:arsenite transporter
MVPAEDAEKQAAGDASDDTAPEKRVSAFQQLGWLDRFLAVWILLSMIIGILLGNFVASTKTVLQQGKFIGVSVPIGEFQTSLLDVLRPGN